MYDDVGSGAGVNQDKCLHILREDTGGNLYCYKYKCGWRPPRSWPSKMYPYTPYYIDLRPARTDFEVIVTYG